MPSTSGSNVPLASYAIATDPDSPWVLSYFAQRRIAGWLGILLPIVTAFLTVVVDSHHRLPDSISASYYTVGRNYFVGSLSAVAIFLISAVGYDEDRFLALFAGATAFVVAFSPCTPPVDSGILIHLHSNVLHGIAAALLFLDLAWMCLFRFTRSNNQTSTSTPLATPSPQKKTRNSVFRTCGLVMVAALITQVIASLVDRLSGRHLDHLTYAVETVCLITFGFAWIVKGQQLFPDQPST